MYALCVSGTVNTQGFVWTFLFFLIFYALYINFHSFVHSLCGRIATSNLNLVQGHRKEIGISRTGRPCRWFHGWTTVMSRRVIAGAMTSTRPLRAMTRDRRTRARPPLTPSPSYVPRCSSSLGRWGAELGQQSGGRFAGRLLKSTQRFIDPLARQPVMSTT